MFEFLIFLVVIAAIWNAAVLYSRLAKWLYRRSVKMSRLLKESEERVVR